MDNRGGNPQIKRQQSLDTQQVKTIGSTGNNGDSGRKYTNTRQKWRDATRTGSYRLRRNQHLYDTEASQATRDIRRHTSSPSP